jgi:nitrilase
MEGGVFVLHAAAVRSDLYKQRLAQLGVTQSTPHGDVNGGGASVVYGPDGTQLAIPENEEYEGLIVVDIDIGRCAVAKGTLDTCGHYSRPDIFCLHVDARQKKQSVVLLANGSEESYGDIKDESVV